MIDLNNKGKEFKEIYDNFFKDYKPKKDKVLKRPDSIRTKMIFISQELVDSKIPENLRIGIWEVIK